MLGWRLRHLDTPLGAAERERVYARHAAGLDRYTGEPVRPTVYPISDGHSRRDGVDRAMSDDSGTDAAVDDW